MQEGGEGAGFRAKVREEASYCTEGGRAGGALRAPKAATPMALQMQSHSYRPTPPPPHPGQVPQPPTQMLEQPVALALHGKDGVGQRGSLSSSTHRGGGGGG